VLLPLDEAAAATLPERLKAERIESVAVSFLHAYANPAHERRCGEIVRALWPNPYVCEGAAILAEMREFERGSTAAIHAFVQPTIARYVGRVSERLRAAGFASELLVTQGNGGVMAASVVAEHAVHTVMSGPAAGAVAAAAIAGQAGFADVITGDMGGTSFDVALIAAGKPSVSSEKDIAYGLPVRVPMIDIHTIGAGGGSIARVDAAGSLRIGPESAGSFPGPIGYGRGGARPTITDANLLLGRLNATALTGSGPADLAAIADAMRTQIGACLGLDAIAAAAAILRVANAQMAAAIRLISVARGRDPRGFVYFPFGGAGPLHAVELCRELGVPTVVVPRYPGLTSALGCLLADLRHDFVQTVNRGIDEIDAAEIDAVLATQALRGRALLEAEAVSLAGVDVRHEADLMHRGQTHTLRVGVSAPGADPRRIREDFAAAFLRRFDIALEGMPVVLGSLRTSVVGRRAPIDLRVLAPEGTGDAAPIATREVWFDGGFRATPIYRREDLGRGAELRGPAIVEQADSTVVIDPGAQARVDDFGNLAIACGRMP
jgi:N-methylhydantoinase A